ncbi:MAG: M23 family metallopeptidase [bacterium]|nr:M23 family metallopeptidase [bacterium]
MDEFIFTHLNKLKIIFASLIILVSLVLLTYILSSAAIISRSNFLSESTSNSSASSVSLVSHSSKVVNSGLNNMTSDFSDIIETTGNSIGHAAFAVTNILANTALAAARIIQTGIATAFRTIGNTIGFFTSKRVVNAVIKPSQQTSVPVIEPLTSGDTSAVASLATLENIEKQELQDEEHAKWPLRGRITTLFGVPHWPYQPTHTGLDISSGDYLGNVEIKPFRVGKVVNTVYSMYGLGNYVIVDHGEGLSSVYAHLATITVKEGQQVTQTTTLGIEGSTGASTGTHLHFEIRVDDVPIDPYEYLEGQPN